MSRASAAVGDALAPIITDDCSPPQPARHRRRPRGAIGRSGSSSKVEVPAHLVRYQGSVFRRCPACPGLAEVAELVDGDKIAVTVGDFDQRPDYSRMATLRSSALERTASAGSVATAWTITTAAPTLSTSTEVARSPAATTRRATSSPTPGSEDGNLALDSVGRPAPSTEPLGAVSLNSLGQLALPAT
jgi:hypothetical protein